MGQREMHAVEHYAAVRQFVFVQGGSRREASRVFGLSRKTIKKMCAYSAPPGYVRAAPVRRPKLGAFVPIIDAILAADVTAPVKQRHTAQRIFERLKAEHGYAGGYSAVKEYVRDGRRERTRAFTELLSHYLFQDRFGRPGKGNDKGKVENLVKTGRRRFLTPVPEAASYEELNARLEADCRARQSERCGRHAETIAERLAADQEAFRALPAAPFEPCDKKAAHVSSTALVRYRTVDYSVPVRYGHRAVVVKGFVSEVVILCGQEIIARHPRSYEQSDFVYNPLHYLPLLERKPGALDQAAPLQGWDLPEVFGRLRRLLEARLGKQGKREYIQVLRLLEVFRQETVAAAADEAIRLGAIGFDAVKQIALARMEKRQPALDLSAYPHVPKPTVRSTRAADYAELMGRAA